MSAHMELAFKWEIQVNTVKKTTELFKIIEIVISTIKEMNKSVIGSNGNRLEGNCFILEKVWKELAM